MGPFYNSLNDLPCEIKNGFYTILYSPFNRAVHPDLKLFADLVREKGSERTFLPDLERPDAGVLRICAMTDAYDLLSIVHFHYGWDCEPMKAEYVKIKEDFANRQGE